MEPNSVLSEFESARNFPPGGQVSRQDLRIVLYSHDTMGLGHKRRNLLIAQTLAQKVPHCSVLLITGMVEASRTDLPAGVDYLALPAWEKRADGQYQARRLGLSAAELVVLRAKTIRATMETFKPDVFIVDNVPRGALRELDLTLEFLQRRRQTHCILGLRDVLDDPTVVRQQWQAADNEAALRRYYDAIWVYGDPGVYDPVVAYGFAPDIAARVRYVGYLDAQRRLPESGQPMPSALASLGLNPTQKLALCLVGGGQDGADLATAFAQTDLPPGWQGLVVTGPFMPPAVRHHLHQQAAQGSNLTILDYCPEPAHLLLQAEAVVAMGGYNTTCELLSFASKALIVPRVKPRREQWIRAQRLQQMGLVDVLSPDQVSPQALANWLAHAAHTSPQADFNIRDRVDLQGLERLPNLITDLITPSSLESRRLSAKAG